MSARPQLIEVNYERLRQELEWYIAKTLRDADEHRDMLIERIAVDAGYTVRNLRRFLHQGSEPSTEIAARLLDAIDYRDGPRRHPETGRVLPFVIRSRFIGNGHARQPGEGRIKRVEWATAKLNERQLRAIHKLHIDGGVSLREICRRGWEQWGYASEKAALSSVSDRLASIGLVCRTPAEGTALANQLRRKRGPDESENAYKRRVRRELYARDPQAHAEALARIAHLRETVWKA